jgi:ABC-type polysaccharide/polyol phosphate export permease
MRNAFAETGLASPAAAEPDRLAPIQPPRLLAARLGLIWTLIRTDFKVRYHGTMGGFVWALLKPVAMFIVLLAVFSFLFKDPTYKLNLIVGLFLWDFFAEGTRTGMTSLLAKGYLLTKARCPSWILVLTSLANAVFTLVVFFVVTTVFLAFVGHPPTLRAVALFSVYCAALIGMVAGISLASSVLCLRYRDLNQVWEVVTQAGFFFAPIVYPLDIIPERFHFYLYAWPPTPIIQFARAVLVAGPEPTRIAHLYLALDVAGIILAGVVVYRGYSRRAAEFV